MGIKRVALGNFRVLVGILYSVIIILLKGTRVHRKVVGERGILAEGAKALSVTLSGGVLFAS